MAESLGAAVLTVSVDDAQLKAGLQAAERSAQTSGQNIQQAFTRSGKPLQTATNGLQFYIDAQGRAREASGRFLSIAQQQAAGLEKLGQTAAGAGSRFGELAGALAGLGIGAAGVGFLRGSIDAAAELETITRKLSNTLGEQGAGQALSFTRGIADELGLSFTNLSNSFGSFTAAATAANVPLEQQKELFAAVATAGQALGLSNEEINGSLLALQQIAAKGTVQAEELRGQLGERLPIALGAAARGLGITQQELIKLVESGKLTASDFFPALSRGLGELTTGADALPTAAQNFQKLQNAWKDLQTEFGTSLLPTVTGQVERLTEALKGVQVGTDANKLGLGGLFGNLGLVPDAGIKAVAQVKQLESQFELTAQQARALFFDAAKLEGLQLTSTGFLPDAQGLERVFARLPELAQQFKDQNTNVTGELQKQQAQAAQILQEELKRRDNIANIETQLKALQEQRKLLPIDSSEFDAATQKIQELQARLDDLSIGNLGQSLQDQLKAAQSLVEQISNSQTTITGSTTEINIDDNALRSAIDQLLNVQNKLSEIDGQKATITVEQINAGVQNGSLTNNFSNLERRSQAAQTALDNAAFGTDEFTKALRNAREASFELQSRRNASQVNVPTDSGLDEFRKKVEGEALQRVTDAQGEAAAAADNVGQAFARVQQASEAVAQAQLALRSSLEGAFDLLTPDRQKQLEAAAVEDIQTAIRAGFLDNAAGNLRGEEAISAANQARSILQSQQNLDQAIGEARAAQEDLANATRELAQKNWAVNVAIEANNRVSTVKLG